MQALGLLLVVALAGAIFIPAVSAIDVKAVEKYQVSPEDTHLIAQETLDEFVSSGALDDKIFADSELSKEPLIIYDPNGLLLFHQYEITKDGKNIGQIRMAASKVLGSPVIMIQETPDPINYQGAITKSEELLKSTFKDAEYSEPVLVCYSYPRIGIMYEVTKKNDKTEKVIIDAVETFIVPNEYPKNSGDTGVWSLYDDISPDQIDDKVEKWNNAVEAIKFTTYTQQSKSLHSKTLWETGDLEPQTNGVWCAVASAKMIAKWYGTSHSLTHIANVMDAWNYSTTPKSPGGVTDPEELYYYDGASDGLQRDAYRIYVNHFIWYDFVDHIDNNDVTTSSIPGHVRACDGYKYYDSGDKYLHIYDPGWPTTSAGSIYWESLETKKTDYVFVN